MAEEIRKEIEQVKQKFGEAVRKCNVEAVAALYTRDAWFLPPNSEIVRGRQAIQESWRRSLQGGLKDTILATVELVGSGDIVNEIGNAKIIFHPEGLDPIEYKDKYVILWKRKAEGWKLHWDIWNSRLPHPE